MPSEQAFGLIGVGFLAETTVQYFDRGIQLDRRHLFTQLIELIKLGAQTIADRPDSGGVLQ